MLDMLDKRQRFNSSYLNWMFKHDFCQHITTWFERNWQAMYFYDCDLSRLTEMLQLLLLIFLVISFNGKSENTLSVANILVNDWRYYECRHPYAVEKRKIRFSTLRK